MPNQTTARLTHEQVKSVCSGEGKVRVCPLCNGKLDLYGADKFLCCNPSPCDPKAVAAKIYELRDAKKLRPSQKPDWQGLTLKEYCEHKHLPAPWVAVTYTPDLLNNPSPMERIYKDKPVVDFAYMDANRKVIFTRFRESLSSKPYSESGSTMSIPYGLWLWTNKQDKDGNYPRAVVVCEGESDQQTLTYHRIPALGVPGVNNWKKEWATLPVLKYADKIVVIQEPPKEGKPDVGKKFVATVAASFPAGKVVPLKLSMKDPSELHIEAEISKEFGGSNTAFLESFAASVRSVMVENREAEDDGEIETITANMLENEQTDWLWYDRFPLGMLVECNGNPDTGKTLILQDIAARATTGRPMPDGPPNKLPPCDVIMLVSEDDLRRTVRPRLEVAGADLSKVHFAKQTVVPKNSKKEFREIALDKDVGKIEKLLKKFPGTKLVVIDPIGSYLGGLKKNADEHIRPMLVKLRDLAEKYQILFVYINHFNKSTEKSAINRSGGAGAFAAVPRVTWSFVKDTESDDTNARTMLNTKGNILSPEGKKGLKYTTEEIRVPMPTGDPLRIPKLVWLGTDDRSLDDVLNTASDPERNKKEAAARWLEKFVDAPKLSTVVYDAADAAGHKAETVKKASYTLKDKKVMRSYQKGGQWWMAPVQTADAGQQQGGDVTADGY